MADYWIKLYTEIIDDPKMALLPDRLWRRVIELFLLAKKVNKEGTLPSTREIAWYLRITDVEGLENDLKDIEEQTGIIARDGDGWFVVNFAKRQEAVPDAMRKRYSREKAHSKEYRSNMSRVVTDDVTIRDIERESEEEIEEESETESEREREIARAREKKPEKLKLERELAYAQEVYTAVTELDMMPPSIRAPATQIIATLRGKYPEKQALIAYLKPFFDRWKGHKTKDGQSYNPLSIGWLEWALAGYGNKNVYDYENLRRYADQWHLPS